MFRDGAIQLDQSDFTQGAHFPHHHKKERSYLNSAVLWCELRRLPSILQVPPSAVLAERSRGDESYEWPLPSAE